MTVPDHHKAIANYLRSKFTEPASVANYRDNSGARPIAIGAFGPTSKRFYSTIGICDQRLNTPPGRYELAALGRLDWIPNALASSIYWLSERSVDSWPMICEDVVKHNAKSTYRHMAFAPSKFALPLAGGSVKWLLGVPIADTAITISLDEVQQQISSTYPLWLVE